MNFKKGSKSQDYWGKHISHTKGPLSDIIKVTENFLEKKCTRQSSDVFGVLEEKEKTVKLVFNMSKILFKNVVNK